MYGAAASRAPLPAVRLKSPAPDEALSLECLMTTTLRLSICRPAILRLHCESVAAMPESLRQQMRVNAVALISLAVALSSLAYNTWRNERTERNRSVRVAAFEVLKDLGELQVIVNFAYFSKDEKLGNPMAGWGRVA